MVTFSEYIVRANRRYVIDRSERIGQAYYNQLVEDNPSVAEGIFIQASYDPFYDDKNLRNFLIYIATRWEDHGTANR